MSETSVPTAEIRLDGVGKRFGDLWAVRGVDLHIRRGEFFTFLGPSGCGKTTLLRLVAGFLYPDAGTISFDGRCVDGDPPWRREVGMVFQNLALWPHMSVFDNVAFGLRQRRVPRVGVAVRVRRALEMVDLAGMEERRPSQLSGGQQQRVALARTLVVEPRALLLDEPLSSLDARLRLQMRNELVRLQRELGITTLYVTHDQEEALALSTRIAVFARGEVIQVGTPQQVYQTPARTEVAAFVGVSNFLRGRVRRVEAEHVEVDVPGAGAHRVSWSPGLSAAPAVGELLVISVRPEALRFCDADGATANVLTGRIDTVLYLGVRMQYEVDVAPGLRVKADVSLRDHDVLAAGTTVRLEYGPRDAVLLPEEGGG